MKIICAEHLGMCFGVRDAITLTEQQAAHAPLTVLGDLVHNDSVLNDLQARGVRMANQLEHVTTATVMITAHGASDKTIRAAVQCGFHVMSATCPLVKHAHAVVQQLACDGFHPVIVGQRNHVEVRGLTEDLESFDVVLTDADVLSLGEHLRIGIAAQTTQPVERVRHLVEMIRDRFPQSEVCFKDTICRPTKQRQSAAIALARQSDVVIVIGGAHSNNTRELAATCRPFCRQVFHVQSVDDICQEWFAGAQTVGITAGTSTPDEVIDAVERHILEVTCEAPAEMAMA